MFENLKKNKKFDLLMELKKKGISDPNVLNTIETTDRSLFVDNSLKEKSNLNIALPIDCGQTISQPLVVALMTQYLELNKSMRVLEICTGSGYQTYILSKLSRFIYTIERHYILTKKAEELFKKLRASNIFCKYGDGGLGWHDQAPFDRIIVTASAPDIPSNLLDQLNENGILIIPIGDEHTDQILKKVTKKGNDYLLEDILNVRFVPMLEGTVK